MSYGVNKSWASQRSPARSAASSKKKRTKTAKKSKRASVPRARKKKAPVVKSARKSKPRKTTKRTKKAKAAKAPKLYKRYDPVDGHLEKVTKDDPRFDEWRTTKGTVASRKKKLLKEDPLEYARTFGVDTAKKRASRAAETAIVRSGRKVAPVAVAGLARLAPALATGAAVTASLAILAAGYVVMDRVAKNQQVKLGDRLNGISLQFVKNQADAARAYGVRTWGDLPAEVKAKGLADYKRALATATSQAQGSAIVGVRESYK